MTPICLNLASVASMLDVSESTVQRLTRDSKSGFPKPRALSGRRVGWLYRELVEWVEARGVSDLPPPPNTGAKKPRHSDAASVSR